MNDDEILALLAKARRSLDAAAVIIAARFFEKAASEAYYAMFYAAKAMLLNTGQRLKQHKQVIRAFESLARTIGKLKFYDSLAEAFRLRHFATYETGFLADVSEKQARTTLQNAIEFVTMSERFLEGGRRQQ
jgi:uncharacterized protein (UPF0332 family)